MPRRYSRRLRQPLRPGTGPADRCPDRLCLGQHTGQLFDRQQRARAEASCIRVFADRLSGKTSRNGQRRGTTGADGEPRQLTGSQ